MQNHEAKRYYRKLQKKEIGILKESAAISAEQAKRDAMLAFKTEVKAEFEKNSFRKGERQIFVMLHSEN